MLKKLKYIIITSILTLLFVNCGGEKTSQENIIKLGINGDESIVWETVRDELKKENITLKFVSFGDYIRPNLALQEKEIDLNAFQTEIYFDTFKKEHNLTIENIAYTVIAPMGIYSKKITDLSQLKDNSTVAIPNDSSNSGRALILLQEAGLIKLAEGSGLFPRIKDIISNPKNLKIVELVATQIPRSIDDVDIAVINNGVAVEANYSPLEDSLFLEDAKNEELKPYFNIIASREDNKDNLLVKRVVEVYQSQKIKDLIIEYYKGSSVPVF